jgi:hypothetical protein
MQGPALSESGRSLRIGDIDETDSDPVEVRCGRDGEKLAKRRLTREEEVPIFTLKFDCGANPLLCHSNAPGARWGLWHADLIEVMNFELRTQRLLDSERQRALSAST